MSIPKDNSMLVIGFRATGKDNLEKEENLV